MNAKRVKKSEKCGHARTNPNKIEASSHMSLVFVIHIALVKPTNLAWCSHGHNTIDHVVSSCNWVSGVLIEWVSGVLIESLRKPFNEVLGELIIYMANLILFENVGPMGCNFGSILSQRLFFQIVPHTLIY